MTKHQLDLSTPPPLPKRGLRVTPLGGLGEIGRNMTVFEHQGKLLIVDCGVLFPEENQPGINVILPDFSSIQDRLQDIEAIVLTHGHEDHIGGVPYLLRERKDIPIIGSELTLALISAKLEEHRITPRLIEVKEGQRRKAGPFDLEFLAVNHSIPDGLAIAIRTEAGLVLHTGDFKMDQFPLDHRLTDLPGFARLGTEGVDLFLVDSTNADVPGFTTTEGDIRPAIDAVFRTAPRRIAAKLGFLDIPQGLLVDAKALERMKDNKVVLICTGSQGEPMAALARMANREHTIRIGEGDTVLLASSLIPGNENSIYRVINGLTRWGANVVHKGNAKVHVSGHASAGELTYCYNIVKPKNVMPVHGEWRHLTANANLAIRTGIDEEQVLVVEDGVVVDLVDGVAKVTGRVQLSEDGALTILGILDTRTGLLVEPVEFIARGFVQDDEWIRGATKSIDDALAAANKVKTVNGAELEDIFTQSVTRWMQRKYRRIPVITSVVVDA